jgi:HEAT repeat protein
MWILKDRDIEKLRIKGDVKGLIKLLKDENPKVRASAAEALGDFDQPEVTESLIEALKDEDRHVRWNSAKSLEYLCRDRVDRIEILIKSFIHSKSVFQKVSLAWLLGRIGDEKAIPSLIESFESGDKFVRRASIIAMGRIGDKRSLPYLITVLKDNDPILRKRTVEALGRIRVLTKEVNDALINALMDPDSGVRMAAAKTLERLGWEPETKEDLAKYLAALKIGSKLVLLGDAAVEPLIYALEHGDKDTKSFASETISEIKSKKAIESLLKVAKSDDWTVRFHALRTLGKMGEDVLEHIIPFLKDSNPNVREAAKESLKEICKSTETLKKLIEKHPELKDELEI